MSFAFARAFPRTGISRDRTPIDPLCLIGRRQLSRARSKPDFIAKLGIVEEEADEVCYWLEILEGIGMTEAKEIDPLKSEAKELISIIIASKKTARANLAKASRPDR